MIAVYFIFLSSELGCDSAQGCLPGEVQARNFWHFGISSRAVPLTLMLRCDPAVVGGSKEVELILTRLSYFLQGKWCASVTRDTGDKERAAAEEEIKDWFAAAEQVGREEVSLEGVGQEITAGVPE